MKRRGKEVRRRKSGRALFRRCNKLIKRVGYFSNLTLG